MRILMAASEFSPLVSGGAIGVETARLAAGLRALGHEVSVALPCYREVMERARLRRARVKFTVPVGASRYSCEIFETQAPDGTQVFLPARDEFFDRRGLYGNEDGDYQDNCARFVFFSKAVVELARRMDPLPEVLHANGWQTALVGIFAREARLPVKTVLSPRGLEYQGNFWSYDFSLTNLPGEYFSSRGLEFFGSMNFLKAGLLYSDAIALPGERYAAVAQTPLLGCGLESVLREVSEKIWGIPDGTVVEGWEPPEGFCRAAGARDKSSAEKLFGWSRPGAGRDVIVFADASPGLGFALAAMDRLASLGVRLGILGRTGGDDLRSLEIAKRVHKGRLGLAESGDAEALAAMDGADFLLVPGEWDPRSPWLERGLRRGLIPIVKQCPGMFPLARQCGGDEGNGFFFWQSGAEAIVDACRHAFVATEDAGVRGKLAEACMRAAPSREGCAEAHGELYRRLAGAPAPQLKNAA